VIRMNWMDALGSWGASYIVLRGYHVSWDQTDLNKWFRLILGGGGGSFQKMDCNDSGGARSASSWVRSVPGGGSPGPSRVGVCTLWCPFRKAIICVKRSLDEGVMPVLPNPALRLISSDSEL
jgi:hypothetical protein